MSTSHPVYNLPGGLTRTLGRDTDATMRAWDRIVATVPVAPRIFSGPVPRKSPNIRRFHHRSFLSQRNRGYCVGFNTCSVLMTRLRIPPGATETTGEPLPLIELFPLYTYDIARWQCTEDGFNMGTQDGLIGSEAFIGSKKRGCLELELYPSGPADIDHHKNGTKPGAEDLAEGAKQLVKEYAMATSFEHGLELLGGGFPISLCSEIPEGMMKTDAKGFFRMAGKVIGGHCYGWIDYDKDQNLAWISQAWERWGEKTADPHFEVMHGHTQIGTCPLDELAQWFSSKRVSSGSSEIMAVNTIEGFAPLIVDYSSM